MSPAISSSSPAARSTSTRKRQRRVRAQRDCQGALTGRSRRERRRRVGADRDGRHDHRDPTGTITFTGATVAAGSGTDEATVTIPSGITQADADTRYVNVPGDTMTGTLNVTPATNAVALFLDARAATTQTPFVFNMNASGNQQAMWLRRGGQRSGVLDD